MAYKKKFLFLALSLVFIFSYFIISTPDVLAADQKNDDTFKLPFIPAMSIPGLYTAGDTVNIDGASLANYIKAIYRYGGMFASIVAMFMLVYAGWQWLLAGGNSSKISQAKDKINGTLIGLVILFGGYLLLSLISKNLISFQPLTTTLDKIPCTLYKTEITCPSDRCNWVLDSLITPNINEAACVDGATALPEIVELDCSKIVMANDPNGCQQYPDLESCENNVCYGKTTLNSAAPFTQSCYVNGNGIFASYCDSVMSKNRCMNESDCDMPGVPPEDYRCRQTAATSQCFKG